MLYPSSHGLPSSPAQLAAKRPSADLIIAPLGWHAGSWGLKTGLWSVRGAATIHGWCVVCRSLQGPSALGVVLAALSRGTALAIGIGILYGLVIEGLISSFVK